MKGCHIALVRHGETDWNRQGRLQGKTDIPLNETGLAQAEACARFLQRENWDLTVSSPLLRAEKTARIIAESTRTPLVLMPAFRERDFGPAEGHPYDQARIMTAQKLAGAENKASLRQRAQQGLCDLCHRHGGSRIILVAHGAVIDAILAGLDQQKERSRLQNGCISRIQLDASGNGRVLACGRTEHLDG